MPLSSTKLQVKGRPAEVLMAGEGEPLVFLHGGGIVEGFDCFEPLAERFRLICPLRPGYGGTDVDPPLTSPDQVTGYFGDLLDELAIERTTLAGHSLGGWLAARIAARFTTRVSELVLGSPFGMNVPDHPMANMMALSPAERLTTLTSKAEIWEGRIPTEPDPQFQAARGREIESMTRFVPGPFDPELADVLSRISMPTLLLWGEDDRLIPVAHARAWEQALPHATVRLFPGTGHLLFHERPEAVRAIEEFVDSCRESSGAAS
jgi:pimeloyl-ACP methyl ester carboxylesterase